MFMRRCISTINEPDAVLAEPLLNDEPYPKIPNNWIDKGPPAKGTFEFSYVLDDEKDPALQLRKQLSNQYLGWDIEV